MRKMNEEILCKSKNNIKFSILDKYPNEKLIFKRVVYQKGDRNITCHEVYSNNILLETVVYFGFDINESSKTFSEFLTDYFIMHPNGYIIQFSDLPQKFTEIFKDHGFALNQQYCLHSNNTVFIKTAKNYI